MCKTLIPMLQNKSTQEIFFSDEATFYLVNNPGDLI